MGLLLILHAVNLGVAAIVIVNDGLNQNLAFVRLGFVFSLLCAGYTIFQHRDNALFAARTLLLVLPGYYATGIQLWNPSLYYSFYERVSQTLDISLIMYGLTNLALAGSEVGLRIGRLENAPGIPRDSIFDDDFAFYALVIPVLGLSQYVSLLYGPSLMEASYASGVGMSGLGSATTICTILLFVMFVHVLRKPTLQKKIIFAVCSGALLLYGIMMRGGRQDVISFLFGIYIIFWLVRGRGAPIKPFVAIGVISLAVLMEYFGFIRSYVLNAEFDYIGQFRDFIYFYTHPTDVVTFSTFSPVAITFANTIYAVKTGIVSTIHGHGYLDYILRTPPEFMYPDRPRDYAWIFVDWNLLTGGGFFELAEAYLNFGWAGPAIVPLVVSFVLSRTYHLVVARRGQFAFIALFGFLSVFLRGTLYQTFAFYRAALVAVVLWLGLKVLSAASNRKVI